MKNYHAREHVKRLLKKTPLYSLVKKRDEKNAAYASAMLQQYGLSIASDVSNLVSSTGLKFYLTCGSLLGAIRDGKFIGYDTDIDFALEIDDGTEWEMLDGVLVNGGYKAYREWFLGDELVERCYANEKLTFDVFGIFPHGEEQLIMHLFLRYDEEIYDAPEHFSVKYFELPKPSAISFVDVSGQPLPTPDNAEEHLEIFYGPSWRTPDPNWVQGTYSKPLAGARGTKRELR